MPRWLEVDAAEMERLYVDEGWSQDRIASHFGVSQPTVGNRLRVRGVTRHRGRRGPRLA